VTRFALGEDFPFEGFVQQAIERHFAGCARLDVGHADFACTDGHGRRWLIEAKGQTSSVGLDFRTGLGQLLQGAPGQDWTLALAMPDTPKFAHQRDRTPEWVRNAIGLHWLIVGADGAVVIQGPKEL
jgi:hypothetical protein